MKYLFAGLVLILSATCFAKVNCKLVQGNVEGQVEEIEMAHLNGRGKHKFVKDFAAGKLASYLVEIDKVTEDVRVEVRSGSDLTLSSWSSFDSTGVMQIEKKEVNGSFTMIYCEK